MVFAIILIIFMLAIVLFHYVQGFFSATLSAIFTIIAAIFAFSYHESVVEGLLGGRVADEAHALVLIVLFAVIYLALRIIFDNVVPGDVRVPATVNKIGAAVMGVVAAIFATGIVAIAAEELPFGASIAGYVRHDVAGDRHVVVPVSGRRSMDMIISDELLAKKPGSFGDQDEHGVPILPVDDIVVGTVQRLSSAGGVLSDGKPLATIHPDFLDELFGQRMGIEPGGSHVAMNLPDKHLEAMKVLGLYDVNIPAADQADSQFKELRNGGALQPVTLKDGQMFLVVRVMFTSQAADQVDGLLRFSPASARLVVKSTGRDSGEPEYVNDYPIGTLDQAGTSSAKLLLNKLDDYVFVNLKNSTQRGADLVYVVNKSQFEKTAPPGTFIEFKRLARVDLAGQDVKNSLPPDSNIGVMRKTLVMKSLGEAANPPSPSPAPAQPQPQAQPQPTPSPQPAAAAGFNVGDVTVSANLPVPITAPAGANGALVQVPGGTGVFDGGKAKSLDLDSTRAAQTQPQKITQFAVPDGQVMVQVSGTPSAAAPWGVATETDQYELVDSTGKRYQPNGVIATYDSPAGEHILARYIDVTTISAGSAPNSAGPPKQVTLLYLVPVNTKLTEFDDHAKKVHDVNVSAQ